MWMQMGQKTFSFEYPGPQEPLHSKDIISISIRDWWFIGGPPMATKVKGLFKGFKNITQIFVVKEHEMEIGYPTDVKHVAHIGWDSASVNAPSWMNELRPSNDYSSTSLGNHGESREASWISQGLDRPGGLQPSLAPNIDCIQPDKPKAPKKTKRKKSKVSSPSSSSRSSRRSSRAAQCTTIDEEAGEMRQVCTIK